MRKDFVVERSPLLSAAPRAVHPRARLCSSVLPQVPALGELPWHTCPNHTLLELCSDPRPCSPHLVHLQREFGLVPAQAPSAVSAPSACSSFPGFSLSSLTLQAASFCWQHPASFLLAFVSWSSCNQSLLEIHWVWEQLWIPLPKLNQMYICSEHCADIRKCSCPLASLGAAARLSNIRWSWEEQVGTAE